MRKTTYKEAHRQLRSIIVKPDSQDPNCSREQSEADLQLEYDLEVRQPADRKKIIADDGFFKKLSLSFYADFKPTSKSLSPSRYM